jgi:hypothetical protein
MNGMILVVDLELMVEMLVPLLVIMLDLALLYVASGVLATPAVLTILVAMNYAHQIEVITIPIVLLETSIAYYSMMRHQAVRVIARLILMIQVLMMRRVLRMKIMITPPVAATPTIALYKFFKELENEKPI